MELMFITLLTFVAALLGTVTGFGISTIMLPPLLLVLPFTQALLLVGIVHWFGNVWKIVLFRGGLNWRLIFQFGIPGVLLSYLGARLAFVAPEQGLSTTLAVFLILYVVFVLTHTRFVLPSKSPLAAIAGGGLSGFFAGIFGVGGAIRAAFLSAFNLPKAVFLSTIGVIGIFIDSVRLGTYMVEGVILPTSLLWGLGAFIPASFVGAWFAKQIVDRIPQQMFRVVVAGFLLLLATYLIYT